MAGTISFGGIGSGIDTESIISGLVKASQQPISKLKSRASSTRAAVSTISDLSSLLGTLKNTLKSLEDAQGVSSFKATSSKAAVVATAKGQAAPGAYDVNVLALAQEHRSYSTAFGSNDTALGQTGTLDLQVGAASPLSLAIEATDTLSDIAGKINQADARVTASVIFDGTNHRLQVRGMDTGSSNGVTLTENGTSLGLATFQAADDAKIEIDGIEITRGTNQFTGVIPGVTLAVTAKTESPIKVVVEADPEGLTQKLEELVSAYNAVVKKVHESAGFGTQSAPNPVLSGDSTLRTVLNNLSRSLGGLAGTGTYQTAASIGLESNRDGTIRIDALDLQKAIDNDPEAVSALLAGDGTTDGIMDTMRKLVDTFIQPTSGLLASKTSALESRAKTLDDQANREQERLDRYAEQLRKGFTQMDGAVAANNAQLDYLVRLYGGG